MASTLTALLQEAADTRDGELKSSLGRRAGALASASSGLALSSFSFSRHVVSVKVTSCSKLEKQLKLHRGKPRRGKRALARG